MKKIVVWYICLFVALGCFMNFLGVNNVGFDAALHKAVGFINGVGDVSQAVLKFVISADDVVAPGLEEFPYTYRKAYVDLIEIHAECPSEGCNLSDPDFVIDYVRNQFCSDFKYYVAHKSEVAIGNIRLGAVIGRMKSGSNAFVNLFRVGKLSVELETKLLDIYTDCMAAGCVDDYTVPLSDSYTIVGAASELCPYH